jgi:hypothetical protein
MRAVASWLLVLCTAALASPPPAPATLCLPGERVQFSCDTGRGLVSLCAPAGQAPALVYRRGLPGRINLLHTADGSGPPFGATTMPLQPGAQVQQIWFDEGGQRHWMGVCVGGMCPQEAVVAVLRGQDVVDRQVCRLLPATLAWFRADVVRFGSDVDDSRSNSRLVALDHVFQPLDKLFVSPAAAPR